MKANERAMTQRMPSPENRRSELSETPACMYEEEARAKGDQDTFESSGRHFSRAAHSKCLAGNQDLLTGSHFVAKFWICVLHAMIWDSFFGKLHLRVS